MIQDNASFTFLHRIADVDRGKIRHLSKVLLGDVSLVAELLKPQRKDDKRVPCLIMISSFCSPIVPCFMHGITSRRGHCKGIASFHIAHQEKSVEERSGQMALSVPGWFLLQSSSPPAFAAYRLHGQRRLLCFP